MLTLEAHFIASKHLTSAMEELETVQTISSSDVTV